MRAMTLRYLDPAVVETLRACARAQGRTLNGLICEILTREASKVVRRERMRSQRPKAVALQRRLKRRHGEGTPAETLVRADRRR